MRLITSLFAVVLVALTVGLAEAQHDVTVGGHVLDLQGSTMIVRAQGGSIYFVDLDALPHHVRSEIISFRQQAGLGQGIRMVGRPGQQPMTFVPTHVTFDSRDAGWGVGPNRRYLRVEGTVVAVRGPMVTIRTDDGRTLEMDATAMRWSPSRREHVAVVYEESDRTHDRRIARWTDAQSWTALARPYDRGDRRDGYYTLPRAAIENGQTWRGHVLDIRGDTLWLGADGSRPVAIDISGLDRRSREALTLGQAITVTGQQARDGAISASYVRADQPDGAWGQGPNRRFLRIEGTVESINGSLVTMRATDGRRVTVDAAQMDWQPRLHEWAVVVYEEGPSTRGQRLGRWVQRQS